MRNYRWLWITAVVIILDQVTKFLVLQHVQQPISITPFFSLVFMQNTGSAFSFLAWGSGWQLWLFGLIAISVSVGLLIWLPKIPTYKVWQPIALALILGGALGNVIDRIIHGFVIDFLLFHINTWAWPAFNIADSAIVVGVIMLLVYKNKHTY